MAYDVLSAAVRRRFSEIPVLERPTPLWVVPTVRAIENCRKGESFKKVRVPEMLTHYGAVETKSGMVLRRSIDVVTAFGLEDLAQRRELYGNPINHRTG